MFETVYILGEIEGHDGGGSDKNTKYDEIIPRLVSIENNDDVFIFVTYHKEKTEDDGKEYIDGKPDYADMFEDNQIFCWDTQIGRGIDSSYTQDVMKAYRKHLMVKKSDAETTFYYMGQFDIVEVKPAKKLDNKGKERDIAKFRVKMRHAVRDDLLQYLESNID